MASETSKTAAFLLLILNLGLYFIITIIASWATNYSIIQTHQSVSSLPVPARIFPIYFPLGNLATGFFVILSLLAGIVGITTSITGLHNVLQWSPPNLQAAASSSLATSSLTFLAMGFACKEISIGWVDGNLRTLEVVTIIVSATQLICTGAIHAGVEDVIKGQRIRTSRV